MNSSIFVVIATPVILFILPRLWTEFVRRASATLTSAQIDSGPSTFQVSRVMYIPSFFFALVAAVIVVFIFVYKLQDLAGDIVFVAVAFLFWFIAWRWFGYIRKESLRIVVSSLIYTTSKDEIVIDLQDVRNAYLFSGYVILNLRGGSVHKVPLYFKNAHYILPYVLRRGRLR